MGITTRAQSTFAEHPMDALLNDVRTLNFAEPLPFCVVAAYVVLDGTLRLPTLVASGAAPAHPSGPPRNTEPSWPMNVSQCSDSAALGQPLLSLGASTYCLRFAS